MRTKSLVIARVCVMEWATATRGNPEAMKYEYSITGLLHANPYPDPSVRNDVMKPVYAYVLYVAQKLLYG